MVREGQLGPKAGDFYSLAADDGVLGRDARPAQMTAIQPSGGAVVCRAFISGRKQSSNMAGRPAAAL